MILLDSHVVAWLMNAPERISVAAATAIANWGMQGRRPAISSVTVYEISYGVRRGRIQLHVAEDEFLARLQAVFELRPISSEIALIAGALPEPFQGDSMDRMIVATAIVEDSVLLTADAEIRRSAACKTLW